MNTLRWLAAVLVLSLLAGCAGTSSRPPLSDDEQLQTRSVERWQYLIDKQAGKAWEYLSPGYRSARDEKTYVEIMSNRPVTWIKAEYDSHTCREPGKYCVVIIKMTFQVRSRQLGVGQLEASSLLTERWIKSDGLWYHVPEDVSG